MIDDKRIGENVAAHRQGLSQKELAERMRDRGWKWSQATVWSIEKGERPLRVSEAYDLADILGMRIWQFDAGIEQAKVDVAAQGVGHAERELIKAADQYDRARTELVRTLIETAAAGHVEDPTEHESWFTADAAAVVSTSREEANFEDLLYIYRETLEAWDEAQDTCGSGDG